MPSRRLRFNPGSGRSPGEENGNPLQYSFLENPMARGAWRATVHGVTESDMTEYTHTHHRVIQSVLTDSTSQPEVPEGTYKRGTGSLRKANVSAILVRGYQRDDILKPIFSTSSVVKSTLIHNEIAVLVLPTGHRQTTSFSCIST